MEPIGYAMDRRMLLGIKERAGGGDGPVTAPARLHAGYFAQGDLRPAPPLAS